jgi:hypothetical protein
VNENMLSRKMKYGFLAVIAISFCITAVFALNVVYLLQPSNQVPLTMSALPTNVNVDQTLTINGTKTDSLNAKTGDTLVLVDQTNPVAYGQTVTFFDGATIVGTATTDNNGMATLTLTPSSQNYPLVGSHFYQVMPAT